MFMLIFLLVCSSYATAMSGDDVNFDDMSRNELIAHYFGKGYQHKEIVAVLCSVHAIAISVRTVKRILKTLGLTRRKETSRQTYTRAVQFAESQLKESGQFLGYRAFWKRLQHNNINLSQKKTLALLHLMDEEGVETRKRRRLRRRAYLNPGPNFVWHMDGYDKLKPYGFPIHGCIDGYSRRILWLHVARSNNNPLLVAQYFVKTAIELSFLPCVVRADRGTENSHVKRIQVHFRGEHDDYLSGEASFQYGKSTGNQRIEAFWGQLRKQFAQFWMNKFKDMATVCSLDMLSNVELLALRFCYIQTIRTELRRTTDEWNSHKIRPNRNNETIAGKPDILYFAPDTEGAAQYGKNFGRADMNVVLDTLENQEEFDDFPPNFLQLLALLLGNVQLPTTVQAGDQLFRRIVEQYRCARNDM